MNGFQLGARLHAAAPDVPFVLTGFDTEFAELAQDMGLIFIAKPELSPQTLFGLAHLLLG